MLVQMTACQCQTWRTCQPMADADRDADQHSFDEIMEPKEDAGEHALLQSSHSSSSSSSSSSCSDFFEELAGCPFPCRGISEDASCDIKGREALRRYRRFILQCNQHPKCTAGRTISEQHTRHLGQYEPVAYLAAWALLGLCAPNRSTKGPSSRERSRCRVSASGFKTKASCRRPSERLST